MYWCDIISISNISIYLCNHQSYIIFVSLDIKLENGKERLWNHVNYILWHCPSKTRKRSNDILSGSPFKILRFTPQTINSIKMMTKMRTFYFGLIILWPQCSDLTQISRKCFSGIIDPVPFSTNNCHFKRNGNRSLLFLLL